ncbi:hypothetical protein [Methylobacterium sp. ap11]|uniref:hypothetical protein n=1 Tax=Methylobacterium sp. ap11 TaxID=1761799 RepID=UPI0015A5D323|nr:hypothetical protein [Methylobacterium sp. ap11]
MAALARSGVLQGLPGGYTLRWGLDRQEADRRTATTAGLRLALSGLARMEKLGEAGKALGVVEVP